MVIRINGIEYTPATEEPKAVAIEMWYDRSKRNWVLYPVDAEGNQLAEATYGFGKAEALKIKRELEEEYIEAEETEDEDPEMTACGLTMDELRNLINENFIDYGADNGMQINANQLYKMLIRKEITGEQHRELRGYNRMRYASMPDNK